MSEIRKKLRDMQNRAEEELLKKPYERDGENRVVLYMNVKNDDSFLSPFSESETPIISSEVADFIEESTNGIPLGEEYALRIKSDCIDEREREDYRKGIKAYFEKRYVQNEREMKRNRILSVVCALVGILVLALAVFLEYRFHEIWAEFIDIVAWVLVWEAVYVEAFENRKARLKRYYYLACMTMKVEYIQITE